MDKHYLYDDVKNLKYWVHAILPLVYDDSLSYYEVLAKVSAKMNEVIEQLNKNSEQIDKVTEFTVTSIENLTQAFNNFQAAMLERQDNFEKKLLKDVADWEEQLMADIDEWEKQLKSEIDEWETTLKSEINTWETNFTNTYNTWKNQLESDIAEWERQLKADNDKWKADTTDELNTWKSDTESALNEWKNETMQSLETWKSNTESDINSWKQEAESDIASWKEQAEQGLDTWKQQAQADITKWENDFQSKYDSWKSEFESTYNSWQSAFEEKYNTWQSTFEASYTEWKNGVDSDLAAWKTQAEKDIQTWESNTENSLNTWKENFQGEQANWEADVQQDIEQKFEQLGEVYVAKTDVVQTTGQSTTQVMSQKAVTDELGKKANSSDVTSLSDRVDNISSELAGDYVAKSDIVDHNGTSTDKVLAQTAMKVLAGAPHGYISANSDLNNCTETGVYAISGSSRNTIKNLPVENNNSGFLIVLTAFLTQTSTTGTHHNQIYVDDVGHVYIRYISESTSSYGTWHTPSEYYFAQTTGQSTTVGMSQKAVTDELNNKASAVAISQQDTLPTISGVNTYEASEIFNGIANSKYAGIIYMKNKESPNYGAEIIVPYTSGDKHGVWYDTIKNNVRQPALKLADTNDLNKKANTYKFDDSLQSQSGIYYRYSASNLFNNIPDSSSATVIQSVNYDTEGYGAEIIIPQIGGNAHGVWYDAIRKDINGRTTAIRLAEQPDLDKANSAITSLQNTLSTTQQQVNGLSAYGLKPMTTAPTSSTELSNTRNFATYLLSYEQFRTQENMPYVINRIQDDLSPCVFAFTCIPLAGGQNNMCEQTLTIYTPVTTDPVPNIFAMFKRYVQSMNAGRPIAAESMWQRIDNNVLQVTPPDTYLATLTALGNGVFSLSPVVYNQLTGDKPKSLKEYSVGGKIIVENVCLSHIISTESEDWVYEQRLSTTSDSTKWTRTVTCNEAQYMTTNWFKINMTVDD